LQSWSSVFRVGLAISTLICPLKCSSSHNSASSHYLDMDYVTIRLLRHGRSWRKCRIGSSVAGFGRVENQSCFYLYKQLISHTVHFIPWMDFIQRIFWDIAVRYPEWSQLSNEYPVDIQVSTCVRFYERNGNILKYHMEVRNMLLFHYYIIKMNYFKWYRYVLKAPRFTHFKND